MQRYYKHHISSITKTILRASCTAGARLQDPTIAEGVTNACSVEASGRTSSVLPLQPIEHMLLYRSSSFYFIIFQHDFFLYNKIRHDFQVHLTLGLPKQAPFSFFFYIYLMVLELKSMENVKWYDESVRVRFHH